MQQIAAIITAYHVFNFFLTGKETDEITQEQIEKDFAEIKKSLQKQSTADNAARALKSVLEFVDAHPRNFVKQTQSGWQFSEGYIEISGYVFKDGRIGFFPDGLRKIIDGCGYPSSEAIIRQFGERGILDCGNNEKRKYQKSVKVNGQGRWLYIFRADEVKKTETE